MIVPRSKVCCSPLVLRRSAQRRPSDRCSVFSLQNAAAVPLSAGASCSAVEDSCQALRRSQFHHRHLCHFGGAPECTWHFDVQFKPPHTLMQLQTYSQRVGQFVWNGRSLSYRQCCRRQRHYDVVSTLFTRCQLLPGKQSEHWL
jgi:hypothetical protein